MSEVAEEKVEVKTAPPVPKTPLEKAVDALNKAQKMAKKRASDYPPSTRGGWTAKIQAAKNNVAGLEKAYCKALFDNSYGFFITGSDKAVELVSTTVVGLNEGLAVDSQALYKRIAAEVWKVFGPKREWTSDCSAMVAAQFKHVMRELDVTSADTPRPTRNGIHCRDMKDCVRYVKDMITVGTNGHQFNSLYFQKLVREQGLKIQYQGKVVPILVAGTADAAEMEVLGKVFKQGYSAHALDESIADGKELVVSVFKSGKKGSKGKKNG